MVTEVDPSALFRQEATELVASIEAGLLELERHPDDGERIASVFRDLHTVKGSGAMFGFAEVATFVHEFETAFDRLRRGEARVGADVIAVSLKACDHILGLLADPAGKAPLGQPILVALARAMDVRVREASRGGVAVTVRFPVDAMRLGHDPRRLIEELAALGTHARVSALTDAISPLAELDPTDCLTGWRVEFEGDVEQGAIENVFIFLAGSIDLLVERTGSEEVADPAGKPSPQDNEPSAGGHPPHGSASETMRVATERLDELMDRVGELVIAEARLQSLAQRAGDPALLAVAEDIQRLAEGLRDSTMSMRMVTIGSITGRFRRLVRDLSSQLDRPIRFEAVGEDTELDKTVIELLADPLVHIIRNAADHGLEAPAVRRAAGKPDHGTIELKAGYCGAEVVIRVRDDGRGLDPGKIRRKAIQRGLLSAEAQPTEAELFRLVLEPGFSTAETVTDLSGRGVGMDVVRRTIETLRGRIELSSEPGYGTTVTLSLPLTLAIIDGLLVEIGGEHYTIPLAAVEECVELPAAHAAGTGASSFLNIRGSLVPFVRLRTLLSVAKPPSEFQKVVVVFSGGARVGLVVDRIVANNQTVIKQLSRLHAQVRGFSGATILGDGTVALILDVPQLVSLGRTDDRVARLERAA